MTHVIIRLVIKYSWASNRIVVSAKRKCRARDSKSFNVRADFMWLIWLIDLIVLIDLIDLIDLINLTDLIDLI
jgi:hypothetical protein